jgi:methionyl-tRNA formyltransferase
MVGAKPGAADDPASRALRIVFFGTPLFAVPTLAALVASRHLVCGVITQPDRARGRGQKVQPSPVKALAVEHDLPLAQPHRLRNGALEAQLRAWEPDLGVVAAYGRIIPAALLAVPPLGMINVHPSLLPKYRGAAPVHRAIIDGEAETGVTIMRVAELLDAGDMLAKARRTIGDDETSDVVERDLATIGAALILEVVEQLAAGTAAEEPQDDMLATYAPMLRKEEGLVDWSLPPSFIHNRVRGLYPWPHAYTYLDGARLILLRTRVESSRGGPAAAGPTDEADPGTVIDVSRDGIVVATGHGGRIAILEVQPEGRRPMPVREYLAGHPVTRGARFTGA